MGNLNDMDQFDNSLAVELWAYDVDTKQDVEGHSSAKQDTVSDLWSLSSVVLLILSGLLFVIGQLVVAIFYEDD